MSTPPPDTQEMIEDLSVAYIAMNQGDFGEAEQRLKRVTERLETWDEDRKVLKIVADKGLNGLINSEWNSRLVKKRLRQLTAD